jgi:hypothetical protein
VNAGLAGVESSDQREAEASASVVEPQMLATGTTSESGDTTI